MSYHFSTSTFQVRVNERPYSLEADTFQLTFGYVDTPSGPATAYTWISEVNRLEVRPGRRMSRHLLVHLSTSRSPCSYPVMLVAFTSPSERRAFLGECLNLGFIQAAGEDDDDDNWADENGNQGKERPLSLSRWTVFFRRVRTLLARLFYREEATYEPVFCKFYLQSS